MKHLKSYQQLNESQKVNEFLGTILDRFEEKVDSKKLFHFLLPFKKEMDSLCRKYYKEGAIDADKIYSDIKSFNLTTESYWDKTYDEDEDNNVVLRYLYKFFVKWPKSFVTGLWDIFHMTVIEPWQEDGLGKVLSSLMMVMWILVGIIVYIISIWSFLFFDMKFNGLTHGKVTGNNFEAAHTETYTSTIMVGKVPIIQYHTRHVDDRWHIQIKGEGGRVEDWVTYSPNASDNASPGAEIKKDDNWSWENTEKR